MAAAAALALASQAFGAQAYNPGRIIVGPAPGDGVQSPAETSGMEYTDFLDADRDGVPDPGQLVFWDGLGGTADSVDFENMPGFANQQIDALAHQEDALFVEAVLNTASIVVSVQGDSLRNSIWYETPAGGRGVWATRAQVNVTPINDLDALELWGPELLPDADLVSLAGDPNGASILTRFGATLVTQAQIAAAIGQSIGLAPDAIDPVLVDVDALMAWGLQGGNPFEANFLFSVQPIPGFFDGGEIWVWDDDPAATGGVQPAQFLNHGGHLWNTAFDVRGAFGVANENIDALEAVGTPVPEPATVVGAAGLFALAAFARRRGHRA